MKLSLSAKDEAFRAELVAFIDEHCPRDAYGGRDFQAGVDFAPEGVNTRIKFRGTSRNNGATEVRLQVYPQGMDSFKATCSLDRQTGEIISLAREGVATDTEVKTAER